jgi:hypothetical protein
VTGRSPASVLAAASEKAATGELTAVLTGLRAGRFPGRW